jgi:hypothetical protein
LRPYRIQLHEALMSIGCGLTEDGAKGMASRVAGLEIKFGKSSIEKK